MFEYEKMLEYPVHISKPNARLAQVIISQYGGPNGEAGAATRYLSQRFAMPYREVVGVMTDIGTEELSHEEMICTILYQLTKNLSTEELVACGMDKYYTDHTLGIYPQSAGGVPFSAESLQSVGDPLSDLAEDMAAEQKARTTYDNLLRLIDDPEVADPIRFLREREIVHFQRFGEATRIVQDHLDDRNFYIMNPAFDTTVAPER